jgi:hypothetical protein
VDAAQVVMRYEQGNRCDMVLQLLTSTVGLILADLPSTGASVCALSNNRTLLPQSAANAGSRCDSCTPTFSYLTDAPAPQRSVSATDSPSTPASFFPATCFHCHEPRRHQRQGLMMIPPPPSADFIVRQARFPFGPLQALLQRGRTRVCRAAGVGRCSELRAVRRDRSGTGV